MFTWVDLDLFYGKVKFGPLCFCMGHFMLNLALSLCVFTVLFNIVINSLGEERAGLCASRAFVLHMLISVWSFFFSSWCQVLSEASDCGTPWAFLLTFLLNNRKFYFFKSQGIPAASG